MLTMTLFTVVFNAVPPVAGFEVPRCTPFAVFVTDKEGFVILALAWVVVGRPTVKPKGTSSIIEL